MGHLHGKRTRFDKTPPEWLPVGAQLGDLANAWSGRGDIIAFVGEGAGQGAAACFVPPLAEMEVDVNAAFGEGTRPEYLPDLTKRSSQFEQPVCMGAVLHEAMHAKHTMFDLADLAKKVRDRFEHDLVTSFEEGRIERRGVRHYPRNRSFLRASALKLAIGDLKEDEDFGKRGHQSMSRLMLLTLARIDAGVLDPADVRPIAEAAERLYGSELVEKLRGVWLRAQAHDRDEEWEPLHGLALEWIKLLEDAGHDPRSESQVPEWLKEMLEGMLGEPGDGEAGEGEGGILVVMAGEVETDAVEEGTDQEVREIAEENAKKAAEAAAERAGHEQQAKDVFGRGTGPGPFKTNSRLVESRPPTGPERAAAVALAKDLERARYRDRVVTVRKRQEPGGKLRMRDALAAAEQRSRGGMVTAEPWKHKRRFHTEDPELKIGVLVDISGSMSRAMQPMAVAAWALSEAARRVQGKVGMVYFGNDVFPTLKPGQHLDEVKVYSAADGTERFDKAFKALNGEMDLLGSAGARLLVVISDLYHQPAENEAERKWFDRCVRAGVAVVLIAPDGRMNEHASEIVTRSGTVLTLDPKDTSATTRAIGAAAVKELQRASR